MSKLDEMRRMTASNVDDSMGVGRAVVHGAHTASGPSVPARWQGVSKSKNAAEIPIGKIGPDPDQPREEFEEEALQRLADSLKTRGQIQPISVRWVEEREQYVILCGERRWRAATLAGLSTLTCLVFEKPVSSGEILAMQMVENLLREDLKPIEQARAYRSLMDSNGWTVSQVARELAVDHSNVSRAVALLSLPSAVQVQVEQGALPPATAYEVSKLDDPAAQVEVAGLVIREKLSRAETVKAVRQAAKGNGANKSRGVKPLLKDRSIRVDTFKVTVEGRKGFDKLAMLDVLSKAVELLKGELGQVDQAQSAARSIPPNNSQKDHRAGVGGSP